MCSGNCWNYHFPCACQDKGQAAYHSFSRVCTLLLYVLSLIWDCLMTVMCLFKWLPLQMVVHSLYQCWGNSCTKTSCLQCTVHQVLLTGLSSTGNKVVWSRIWWGFCHISVLVWKSKCLTLTCIQWPKITAYCTSLKLPQYSGDMYFSHTVIIPKPIALCKKRSSVSIDWFTSPSSGDKIPDHIAAVYCKCCW